ncbi:hypothetical protein N7488_007611 [Penicillium malachiteum]|nr:hypothetical protein N7488_007611 [Penicillium malachiteum]
MCEISGSLKTFAIRRHPHAGAKIQSALKPYGPRPEGGIRTTSTAPGYSRNVNKALNSLN